MTNRAIAIAGVLSGALALSGAAWSADSGPEAAGPAGLEEVVVTAEKRESTVQKTPISITAFSGADLQAQGITDLLTVAQQVPGVSFKTSGPGQTELEMRGLTSTGGESPTVGFYLDETSLTPPAMAQNGKVVISPNLYDLNRIEILRGPQGTLYGAGSMGGTVKLVTNAPDPKQIAASVQGIGSGTDNGGFNHTANAMLNLPLVQDVAALRLVVTDEHNPGWIDRDVLNPFPIEVPTASGGFQRGAVAAAPLAKSVQQSNTENLVGGRATLLVTPLDGLTVTLGALYQRILQSGPNTIDVPPGNLVHYQPFDIAEPFKDTFNLQDLTIKYDFDGFQIVSASSAWTRQENQTQDISEAMQYFIGGLLVGSSGLPVIGTLNTVTDFPFSTAGGGLGPGTISEDDYTRQGSEELRIASTGNGPFQWLGGLYYSSFHATSHVYSYYDGFTAIFGTNNLADNHRLLDLDQYAAFGEVSYQLPYSLKATVGARYYNFHSNSITSVSGVSASGTTAPLFATAQNSGVSPKVNLAYIPNDNLTVYGTISKGFRPGGPNSPIPVPPCPPGSATQFGPDTVWSYELGEKMKALDSRVSINGDVYYEDWSNLQQQVAPLCGFKFTANAGKAKVYGAELEATILLAPGLVFAQSAGYTHATNTTTVPDAGVKDGDRLLDVPQFTANTSLTYRYPLPNALSLIARINNNYVDSIQDITAQRNTLPPYDLVDTRLGVASDHWSAALFVNNLANKKALLSDTGALSANINILNRVAVTQPRTIGADLTYRY
jgi:iron complex outermembrane recepter protein